MCIHLQISFFFFLEILVLIKGSANKVMKMIGVGRVGIQQ